MQPRGAAAAVTASYGEAAEEAGKKAEEAGKKPSTASPGAVQANPPKYDGKSLIANARTYNELANNITYYEGKLKNLAPSQEAEITRTARTVAALKRQQGGDQRRCRRLPRRRRLRAPWRTSARPSR